MKFNFKLFLTFFISVISIALFADVTPPPTPQNVPLDGGIILLLSAAAGFAANRLKKNMTKAQ